MRDRVAYIILILISESYKMELKLYSYPSRSPSRGSRQLRSKWMGQQLCVR